MVPGHKVYSWNSAHPLDNMEYRTIANEDFLNWVIPWQLITAFYSRMSKIEWTLNLKPIKVADCRVSLDVIFTYENYKPLTSLLSARALNNDSVHKQLDDTDDNLSIDIPMHFMTDNVSTYSHRVLISGGAPENVNSCFLPTTNAEFFIRNPYQNSQIQPDKFSVLVTLKPKVMNNIGLASTSLANINAINDGLIVEIPRPHFISAP
jgi:hypothetical protein